MEHNSDYRVVRLHGSSLVENSDYLEIMEVEYDQAGNPLLVHPATVNGDNIDDLKRSLMENFDKVKTALDKPILSEDDLLGGGAAFA